MQFLLSETSEDVRNAVARWVERQARRGRTDGFDRARWSGFLELGLLDTDPATLVDRCVGLMEGARAGLPGPVLEAQLALEADRSGRVREALAAGQVVTSVLPGGAGPVLTGWGGVADLVLDQATGDLVAERALPQAQFAYPVPHGWHERVAASVADPLAPQRWLYGAALLAGLCQGALEITGEYVKVREQFGNVLASYQAIQFPLAECKVLSDGVQLSALDAATRRANGHAQATVSAALAWLVACQVAERVTRVCHQSFGSTGFCYETGLVDLSWAMSWLRLQVGSRGARQYLAGARRLGRAQAGSQPPGCLVLEGFAAMDA